MASKKLITAMLATLVWSAHAQDQNPMRGESTVAPLARTSEVVTPEYLDAMGKIEAELQLTNKRNELKEANKRLRGEEADETLPQIINIVTDGASEATAKVMYRNGMVRDLRAGDVVAKGVRVKNVSMAGVQITGHKKDNELQFYVSPYMPAGGGMQTGLPPVPGIR